MLCLVAGPGVSLPPPQQRGAGRPEHSCAPARLPLCPAPRAPAPPGAPRPALGLLPPAPAAHGHTFPLRPEPLPARPPSRVLPRPCTSLSPSLTSLCREPLPCTRCGFCLIESGWKLEKEEQINPKANSRKEKKAEMSEKEKQQRKKRSMGPKPAPLKRSIKSVNLQPG